MPVGRPSRASIAGIPSLKLEPPPATVVMMPVAASTRRTRPSRTVKVFRVPEMKRLPAASTAIPRTVPMFALPATVVMMPVVASTRRTRPNLSAMKKLLD